MLGGERTQLGVDWLWTLASGETQLPWLTHAYSMLTSFADLDIFNMTLV